MARKRNPKTNRIKKDLQPAPKPTPLVEPAKPKRKKTVGWEWKHPRGHLGILGIDSGDGQGKIHYLVRRVDVSYIAFNIANLNKASSSMYSLVITPEEKGGYCTCPGFQAYGTCRHFEAMSTKVNNGDALNR